MPDHTRIRNSYGIILLLALIAVIAPHSGGAQHEDKKPLVVVIYADWCPFCQRLKPVLARINEKYKGEIRFVRLDVTSEASTSASREEARSLGLEPFLDENKTKTSLVIIQDPAGHEVFRALHDYNFQHYAKVLDQQLRGQQK